MVIWNIIKYLFYSNESLYTKVLEEFALWTTGEREESKMEALFIYLRDYRPEVAERLSNFLRSIK